MLQMTNDGPTEPVRHQGSAPITPTKTISSAPNTRRSRGVVARFLSRRATNTTFSICRFASDHEKEPTLAAACHDFTSLHEHVVDSRSARLRLKQSRAVQPGGASIGN